MSKLSLKNLNDGGMLRDGSIALAVLLLSLLFCTGGSVLYVALFLILGMLFVAWNARCYSLQLDISWLVLPIMLVSGLFICFVHPFTVDEIAVTGMFHYGNGYMTARLFSAPTFYIASAVGFADSAALYAARIVNLIACCAMVFMAVRNLPFCKSIAAAIVLMPSSMISFATANHNSTIIAASMLFLSLALRAAYTKDEYVISNRFIAALSLSALLMLVCSPFCLPLLTFLFIIPHDRFGKKRSMGVNLILLILSLCAVAAVMLLVKGSMPVTYAYADVATQAKYVLTHPVSFIVSCLRTLFTRGGELVSQVVSPAYNVSLFSSGGYFGVNWICTAAFAIAICYTAYFDSGLSTRRQYIIRCSAVAVLLFMLGISVSCYLHMSEVGDVTIAGLTSEAFLPCALPGAILLKRMFKHPAAAQKNCSLPLLLAGLANLCLAAIVGMSLVG